MLKIYRLRGEDYLTIAAQCVRFFPLVPVMMIMMMMMIPRVSCGFCGLFVVSIFMAYKQQPAGKWVYLATKYCWFLDGTGMVNDKLGAWPRCGSFA